MHNVREHGRMLKAQLCARVFFFYSLFGCKAKGSSSSSSSMQKED